MYCMKVRCKAVAALVLAAVISLTVSQNLFAEEKKPDINTSHSIRQILSSFTGQRVTLMTDSGEAMEGTVTSVGDHLVHISRLSGKDFYDSVVVIDRISSVVFRTRK